jgi:hypothetical protein
VLLAFFLPAWAHAEGRRVVDILDVVLGKPYPIVSAEPFEDHGDGMPFFTYHVPMPENSRLGMFPDYLIYALKPSGNVYAMHADKTFESMKNCRSALKSVIEAIGSRYKVSSADMDGIALKFKRGDLKIQAFCSIAAGTPFPRLHFRITSISDKNRVSEQLSRMGR